MTEATTHSEARDALQTVAQAECTGKVVQVSAPVFDDRDSTVAYLPYPSLVAGETLWVEHVEPVEECRIVERATVLNAIRMGAEVELVREEESAFAGESDG